MVGLSISALYRKRQLTFQLRSLLKVVDLVGISVVVDPNLTPTAPITYRLGTELFQRRPVMMIEMIEVRMEGFGQPYVSRLGLLQIGGLTEIAGPDQSGYQQVKPPQTRPGIASAN